MRQLIYETLSAYEPITEIVGAEGVYSTYDETPATPFVVVRMGTDRPGLRGVTKREFFQVWAHDVPGDYATIDALLGHAEAALVALPNQGTLFEVTWIENSGDLPYDPLTGVIGRYSRYQHASRR